MTVPIYPRLQRLLDERGKQESIIRDCQQRLNETAVEGQRLDAQIKEMSDITKLEELSRRREETKRQYQILEQTIAGSHALIERLDEEYGGWAANFAGWLQQRESLIRQLASAVPGEQETYCFALERDVPKTRGQVEAELADVIGKIEAFAL